MIASSVLDCVAFSGATLVIIAFMALAIWLGRGYLTGPIPPLKRTLPIGRFDTHNLKSMAIRGFRYGTIPGWLAGAAILLWTAARCWISL